LGHFCCGSIIQKFSGEVTVQIPKLLPKLLFTVTQKSTAGIDFQAQVTVVTGITVKTVPILYGKFFAV
jgi:hypothetical protein